MKKKIVSLLLFGMCFFGGFGLCQVFASTTTFQINPNGTETTTNPTDGSYTVKGPTGTSSYDAQGNKTGFQTTAQVSQAAKDAKKAAYDKQAAENAAQVNKNVQDARAEQATKDAIRAAEDGKDNMTSPYFTLNPNDLSPSEKEYTGGTKMNFTELLKNIGKYLLIATTTIAVLSIVVGGLMISTTGPSDRAAKGKTIIMLNIMAVVVALFSYSIIRLVSWIIAA